MTANSRHQLGLGIYLAKASTGRSQTLGKVCPKCQKDQWYVRFQGTRKVRKCVNCLRAWKRKRRAELRPLQEVTCTVCEQRFKQRRGNQKYCGRACLKVANVHHARGPGWSRGQPGPCEACGEYTTRRLWDHNHRTGDFRGWLCNGCNSALGFTKDNPIRLRALALYVERYESAIAANRKNA